MRFYSEEKKAIRDLLKLGLGFHIVELGMNYPVSINADDVFFLDGNEELSMNINRENECYELMIKFYSDYKQQQNSINRTEEVREIKIDNGSIILVKDAIGDEHISVTEVKKRLKGTIGANKVGSILTELKGKEFMFTKDESKANGWLVSNIGRF